MDFGIDEDDHTCQYRTKTERICFQHSPTTLFMRILTDSDLNRGDFIVGVVVAVFALTEYHKGVRTLDVLVTGLILT